MGRVHGDCRLGRPRGRRMFPLQWLVLVLAPLAVAQPAPPNCCATKTVGGVDYTFVREDSAAMSYSCLSSCVYERDDQPGTAFCFAQGDQQVVCGDSTPGTGQVCAQVICCGSDGVTYPTPCSTPSGVTCVDYNECPAPEPPLPPVGCPGCPVTGGPVLSPENQAIVDWTVQGLQGSDGLCKKTKVEVNNFSTQVVAGTMYEFDLVLDHAEDSAAECGAPDGLREVCHMAVWEKVWEDFREVQWDRSTCIRPGSN